MEMELSQILGRKVDLNTPGFLVSIIANAFYPRPKCSMTQHVPTVRMRHMLDHAKEAVDLLACKEKADLSRLICLSLSRN
jgi:hypothetical protein